MMTEVESKRIQGWRKGLESNDDAEILSTLDKVKMDGDAAIMPALLETFRKHEGDKIHHTIRQMLFDLKVQGAAEPLIAAIRDKAFAAQRETLVASFWQSSIDGSDHLIDFVEVAVDGTYLEAVECLTVIENLDGPFQEEQLLDAMLSLNTYLEAHGKDDKAPLIKAIRGLVITFDKRQ